jgi:hypothetical protein
MRRAGGLAIVVIIVARGACAQDAPVPDAPGDVNAPPKNLWFVRAGYSPAHVLTASPLGSGENEARTLTFELGRQTDGTRAGSITIASSAARLRRTASSPGRFRSRIVRR